MLRWVADRLGRQDCRNGYLLDGFPRTMTQAEAFDQQLSKLGHRLNHVIHLHVDSETLTKRLLDRQRTECRPDDVRRTIACRFDLYKEKTEPLLAYYRQAGLVRPVDGDGSPEEVFEKILRCIEDQKPP